MSKHKAFLPITRVVGSQLVAVPGTKLKKWELGQMVGRGVHWASAGAKRICIDPETGKPDKRLAKPNDLKVMVLFRGVPNHREGIQYPKDGNVPGSTRRQLASGRLTLPLYQHRLPL